jgi:hypothetical protein
MSNGDNENKEVLEDDEESLQKKIEQQEKNENAYSSICLKEVMSTVHGRHFMWEILSDCGIYLDNFSPDPYVHARASGSRRIGLRLLQRVLAECPGAHEQMFAEHKYKEESD